MAMARLPDYGDDVNMTPPQNQPNHPHKPVVNTTTLGGLAAALTAAAGWVGTEFIDMDRRLTRMESQWDAKTEEVARAIVSIESLIAQVDRRLYLMERVERRSNSSSIPRPYDYYGTHDLEQEGPQ